MTNKEAISYAQVTLNFMQSSQYEGEINAETFGEQMRYAFKLYKRNIICNIAEAQIEATRKLNTKEIGSDAIG